MSQSQNAETGESAAANPTRRKFIKGVMIGTGAAAIGGVSTQTRFSPVGTSEAVLPAAAILAGGLIAGGVARYAYEEYTADPSSNDGDPLSTQVYSIALSNQGAFEQRRDNIAKASRVKRFEDSLWSEVRAAGARAFENDQSASTAQSNAYERMDEVFNNRLVNIIRAWNAEVGSAQSALQIAVENDSVTNLYYGNNHDPVNGTYEDTYDKAKPSELGSKVENGFGGFIINFDNLLKGEETIDVWFLTFDSGTTSGLDKGSAIETATLTDGTSLDPKMTNSTSIQVDVDDPQSDSTVRIIDPDPYKEAIKQTFDTYNSVRSDAETYLNNLETGYEKGTVDSSSVLTGRELMEEQGYVDENGNITEEYEGATDEERLAAESIASGMGAPDDAGVRARVNHASLSSERTGNLFIDFAGNGGSLTVGEIAAADYNYAIMGVTYDDGSFGVETLESEADDGTAQPIEVIEVIGAEEREFSYTDEEITVGSGGDVVVYEGTDPPKELANPSEYEGFEIDIKTPNETASVPIADVTESGSQYIAPTSLSEGETVESITFRAPVSYEEYSSYSSGDTTVDLERLKEQEEVISRQQEQLEELQNQGTGGGGGFLPDVSVDSNSTVIAAVAVVLVAFGLLNN